MPRSAHKRLLAYQLARDIAAQSMALTRTWPHGYEALRSQIDRASLASLRKIADGASCEDDDGKIAAYVLARGEMGELEASLGAVELLGLTDTQALRDRADQVGVLLTGLVERLGAQPAL